MNRISYTIRPIEMTDDFFLWEMLYQALYVAPENPPLPRNTIFQPELAKYVRDWGLYQGDSGLVAILEGSKTPIGAVWLRIFQSNNPGYGYLNDDTPELSIAVLPEYRDRGIGTELLTTLFSEVKSHYSTVSLSVSSNNPALHLYFRLGFKIVSRDDNSFVLKKDL